ncbi:MFS transporter [Victivallis lenta]|mgnify:FL=1|uniref:MFS transporter n=1 Tax=Victivallis lenta TaxID=2606640 RepID=UPI0023573C8E|nr:MFS transporter [Victivallis lenta]
MTRHTLALWRLSLLTAIHFTVDMLSGTLPGFLPALRQEYALSLVAGTVLLTLCSFSSNGIQLWAGTLRKAAKRPRLVQLGLLLSCAICFAGLAPQTGAFAFLVVLVLVLGTGVAFAHPEGLRGICAIPEGSVTPAVATSLFMLAGFTGYATGPLIGGVLVEKFGFAGLYFLLIPVGLLLWLFHRARVRLALDNAPEPHAAPAHRASKPVSAVPVSPLTFRELFLLAVLINAGCGIMQGLLPSYMEELGFTLSFGGFSGTLFGLGAGLGAFGTSFLIKRYRVLSCLKLEIAAGIPLLVLYLALAGSRWAACLAPLAGMLVGAGFPQLVVLARTAQGSLALGARMGMIVGGSWGIAGIMLLLAGVAGKYFMLKTAMYLAPACFAAALAMLFILGKRGGSRAVPVQR